MSFFPFSRKFTLIWQVKTLCCQSLHFSSYRSKSINTTFLYGGLQCVSGVSAHPSRPTFMLNIRSKSKKSRRKETDEFSDDSDEENDDHIAGKGAEIKNFTVGSMRLDLIIKMGLGLARNKVEESFFESKIRINSKKVLKKSAHVQVGDEVDLIKGPAPSNPKFITVGRIEILSAKPRDDDSIGLKIRRSKQLLIENYPDGDPWKPSEINSSQ